MLDTCKEMFSLMCDMAEEGVQRARIKAQQNRINEVVRIDKAELEKIYAKIGRIDVLGGDKTKREELVESANKIESRISRAEFRLEQLKRAASVDECTKAFQDKLKDTVKSAKESAEDVAKDLKERAAEKGSDLKDKLTATAEDLSIKAKDKAADISIKAKDKAADISVKAKDKAEGLSEKAKDTAKNVKAKTQKLQKSAPEKAAKELQADEDVINEVDDILKRIEETINSVDEESADEFKF